jgi:hypothetical protein
MPNLSELDATKTLPDDIDWNRTQPFITSISGFGTYEVNVKVHSMAELHAAHDLIVAAFNAAAFDKVIAGVIDAQQA